MDREDPNVKTDKRKSPADSSRSVRLVCWLDRHPRTGWYLLIWTTLVNLDITFHWFTAFLHAIGAL